MGRSAQIRRRCGLPREGPQPEAAVVLVRGRADAERLARRPLARDRDGGLVERPAKQPVDGREPRRRERERLRLRRAGTANRPSRPRRVPDEWPAGAALRAARQMRQVTRQPEELELERERKGVERGAGRARLRRPAVEDVEKASERVERATVPL